MHVATLCLPLAMASACRPALARSPATPLSRQILQLAFSPDGVWLAERFVHESGSPGLQLSTADGYPVAEHLFEDEFALYGLAWCPDAQSLAVLGDDSLMQLDLDLVRRATHALPMHHHGAALAWDPQDQGIVALPAAQNALFWWDLASNRAVELALPQPALAAHWNPDGTHLAISLVDQHTLVWSRRAVTEGR